MNSEKKYPRIYGAIAGDALGSPYELFANILSGELDGLSSKKKIKKKMADSAFQEVNKKTLHLVPDFKKQKYGGNGIGEFRFTDDTVLTIATADALMRGGAQEDFADAYFEWGGKYPNSGFGDYFSKWLGLEIDENFEISRNENLKSIKKPYLGRTNGAAMRVSPIAFWTQNSLNAYQETLDLAQKSALVSHNHPEGIKGAQATALLTHLALTGAKKEYQKHIISNKFGYNLDRKLSDIRKTYLYEQECKKSVPEAMIAYFEAEDYDDAVYNAISLFGDTDTQAAIAGSFAGAFYGVPNEINEIIDKNLPEPMREIAYKFDEKLEK